MKIRIQIQSDEMDASEFFDNAEDAQDWLIEHTDLEPEEEDKIRFYHIGGNELLMDGTQEESVSTLEEMRNLLDSWEIEYDEEIDEMYELANSVEEDWEENWNEGGGSGWIE